MENTGVSPETSSKIAGAKAAPAFLSVDAA